MIVIPISQMRKLTLGELVTMTKPYSRRLCVSWDEIQSYLIPKTTLSEGLCGGQHEASPSYPVPKYFLSHISLESFLGC